MQQQTEAELQARRLNWNLLKTFLVLAESRSVTEAAERLFLRQPTVSHALKQLEEHFNKPLIERRPGRFQLTEAGEALYHEIVEIHGTILRFHTLMREVVEEVKGHVRLLLASHVQCPLFDETLRDFHHRYPQATLSIDVSSSRDAVSEIEARRASMAICLVHHPKPELEYLTVYREFFGLFCGPSHPLFGQDGLDKTALAGQASVSFATDSMTDALRPVALMRAEANLDERVVATSSNLEEVRRMIIAGLGIGPLPLHVVKRDVADGLLWRLPPYEEPPAVDVYLVWNPKARMNRAETAMLNDLRARLMRSDLSTRTYA
ncbi:MAG: LysR family transcriptional regulator [Thiolinea sp.]